MPNFSLHLPHRLMHNLMMLIRLLLLLFSPSFAFAGEKPAIFAAAERHAWQLVQSQNGRIEIEAGPLDISRLIECRNIETYTPNNMRSIGRTHVGVRCTDGANWNILVPVRISVFADYVSTRRALVAGSTVHADDLSWMNGDLAQLPTGTITQLEQAVGKRLRNSVGPGQALRADQLQATQVILQGQTVPVISRGTGFAVKGAGKAMNDAAEGDLARARMPSGKTVSGIAQSDGSILLSN